MKTEINSGRPCSGKKSSMKPRHKWYDDECVFMKKILRRLALKYGKDPKNEKVRENFHAKKKEYRQLLKSKKLVFNQKINEDIMSDKQISWNAVKNLRSLNDNPPILDVFDIEQFYQFFKDLYGNRMDNLDLANKDYKQNEDLKNNLNKILDDEILMDELQNAIKSLKNGKAAGLDQIANEYLKHSTADMQNAILNLFNGCLEHGIYPWNTTIMNPLHKMGDVHNPDNYRAIAIGSNLGKLFSAILLQRLLNYRREHCPDTKNQLGFQKGAQTSDQIFTLNTCVEKYVKHMRKRLYTCFVDFKKAFDTICRDLLLHKLQSLGIKGRFFKCLEYMYTNSKARLKIMNKMSEVFDILQGTEQGHPMSPELFKIYIHELSTKINELKCINTPMLNSISVSHLLWADDLVLIALDGKSLQYMINELESYCSEWGLEVNLKKTAVMIFNVTGRQLKECYSFYYNGEPIASTKLYCYLGICYSLSGSMKPAQIQLKQKALRAYFSLKKQVCIGSITKEAVFKLFDALIKPIVSYSFQTWGPSSELIKILASTDPYNIKNEQFRKIYTDPLEKLHLSFLKWSLAVTKQTSNTAIWGDSGRMPLGVILIKQLTNYYNKLNIELKLRKDEPQELPLACHALAEQKLLNLQWYTTLHSLMEKLDPSICGNTESLFPNATLCQIRAKEKFEIMWNEMKSINKKLGFYNMVKDSISLEPYLNHCKHFDSKIVAKLRMSDLKINRECGRYGSKRNTIHSKCCEFCTDISSVELLSELPHFEDPILEDELHIIKTCPKYEFVRHNLSDNIKSMIFSDIKTLFEAEYISEFAAYVRKIYYCRFPKEHEQKSKNKT